LVQVIPAGQSFAWKHWTHCAAWQIGTLCGQSLFDSHATQVPPGAQIFPGCEAQSAFDRHCTHDVVIVLHSGVSPAQPELLVHPALQWNSPG
jgi:hypothetical protein